MQVLRRAALIVAIGLPLSSVPLTAQFYRWDFNVNGGYSWLTGKLLDDSDVDFVDDVDDEVAMENGFMLGAQLGYWFSRSFGMRGNFAWTGSGLEGRRNIFTGDPDELFDYGVNLYGLTLDGLIRFKKPNEVWSGFEWMPYATLGLGAQFIDPEDNEFRIVDEFPVVNPLDANAGVVAAPIRCSAALTSCAFLEDGTSFTGLIALGTDLRFSPSFAARLEFGDRIWSAPIQRVVLDPAFPLVFQRDEDLGRTINQFYLTLGFAYLFGKQEPERAAVVVAPPPPTPAPPPTTESVSVCVVDPNYAQGLRTVTATYDRTRGDTTVISNGQSIPLSAAVANVPVAGTSSWYISGAPLVIGSGTSSLQYTATGSERLIEPTQLAYIGTAGGIPVFADRSTLPPVLANLGPNTDLNNLMAQAGGARTALATVPILYVPVRATGCAFQPMQKMQEVRKNRLEN